MTNFTTDLFWVDEKQPLLPEPAHPHDHQQEKKTDVSAPVAQVENLNARLQQVAGNAALAQEAEQAAAAQKRITAAAQRPDSVATRQSDAAHAKTIRKDKNRPEASNNPTAAPAEQTVAAEKLKAEKAASAEAHRLSETSKAAAARASALAQVITSFNTDAGKAKLATLAELVENAPPGIAEGTARTLALAVMRADPEQRAAIAARIKAEIGDRRDMRLAQLLANRLAWLVAPGTRSAPPRPPPPPPPE